MKASDTSLGSAESPNYGLIDADTVTALAVGGTLFMITILSMLAFADTPIGQTVIDLYAFLPIVGMVVVGSVLSLGYWLTMKGLKNKSYGLSIVGTFMTIVGYGAFGSAVLTPYAPNLYQPAILVAGLITTVIGLISSAYVYSSNRSFESYGSKSGKFFLWALLVVGVGSFIPGSIGSGVVLVGFILVVLGFILDLIYEIWQVSSGQRSPVQNGFGLYVAFTGVFVHILQIILEFMSGKN
jgi:FtsH-binding integral membrane protein